MPTVRVEETVDVARAALFAVMTDHEGFGRFSGIEKCVLVRAGRDERNGAGALRRVHSGPVVLEEEIIAYDAPSSYEYRIRRARPLRMNHTLGRVEFESVDANRTKVVWTSTFEFPLPILGKAIGKRAAAQVTRGFRKVIREAAALAMKQAA
jgi:uncharacterized protein YndB with AHSA1/START domain